MESSTNNCVEAEVIVPRNELSNDFITTYSNKHSKSFDKSTRQFVHFTSISNNKENTHVPNANHNFNNQTFESADENVPSLSKAENFLNHLLNDCSSVKFPNRTWNYHTTMYEDEIIFSRVVYSSKAAPFYDKQVLLNKNNQLKVFTLNKLVETTERFRTDFKELNELIQRVNNMEICCGGPSINSYGNVSLVCAYKDVSNKWRHQSCPLLIAKGNICEPCSRLDCTLCVHVNRKIKNLHKPRLMVSPSKKKALGVLKNVVRLQSRYLRRYKLKSKFLRSELLNVQNEMKELQGCEIDELLQKYEISDQQKLLIHECITARKTTSHRGKKYNDEWLLLCLLLHMRSSTTYNFLRENKILPLPCRSTILNYLKMIDINCGFDKDFFSLLKKKFSKSNEMSKHGVLVFDEIKVRRSLAVNVKKLRFDGTDNFDSEKNSTAHLADHGLVFMFQSLGENYKQPVGVIASAGPAKGQHLALLVIQCILHIESAGGYIDGIICDGATMNRKMWKELGITGEMGNEKHFFENPYDQSRKIRVFSDTPHLIKCIFNVVVGCI